VPLMALVFPVVWRCLDMYGVAKIDLAFEDIVHNEVIKVFNISLYVKHSSLTTFHRKLQVDLFQQYYLDIIYYSNGCLLQWSLRYS